MDSMKFWVCYNCDRLKINDNNIALYDVEDSYFAPDFYDCLSGAIEYALHCKKTYHPDGEDGFDCYQLSLADASQLIHILANSANGGYVSSCFRELKVYVHDIKKHQELKKLFLVL